jgi:hypothetical protein
VIAPTHLKFVAAGEAETEMDKVGYLDQASEITEVWRLMENQMRQARAIVFIGYSFPAADLYFSSVLRTVLQFNPSLGMVVVNPDAVAIAKRVSTRFGTQPPKRFFDMDQFSQCGRKRLLQEIGPAA